jgi:heme a synthase
MESPFSQRRASYAADSPRRLWLHRYAIFVAVFIVTLIFIGGQVKSTESGLSVPDWPNTYDHFMFSFPWEKMVGGIFWEHLHRMVASVAGLLTFVLTAWTIRVEPRRWVRNVAIAATVAVLLQGLLGGLTVLYYLPLWISASHGTLAQIYLCLVTTIVVATSRRWSDGPAIYREPEGGRSIRTVVMATTAVVFLQLVIGALMRHSEAGLAIPDFPTMFGSWIPPLSDERLAAANKELWSMGLLWDRGISEITLPQMLAHLLHRAWAAVVTGMIIWTAIRIYRLPGSLSRLRGYARGLVALVTLQVALGILTILTEKQFTITSLHVVTGAVTLATSLALTLRIRAAVAVEREPEVGRQMATAMTTEATA